VNVGFWGVVDKPPSAPSLNTRIEELVTRLGGLKSLYSKSTFTRERFRELYEADGLYERLRSKLDPDRRVADLYNKVVD
jgi:FAD/FMN-containing dehydrogenase